MADDIIIAQQEPIPPATEIDCIETNKVFDECLIRDCLTAPTKTRVDVDSGCITDITCSDFTITVRGTIVPVRKTTDVPGFVRISFPFEINYKLNITSRLSCSPIVVPGVPINASVSNVKLYCPEALAYILTQQGTSEAPAHLENTTLKLEFVGECIDVDFRPTPSGPCQAEDKGTPIRKTTDITPIIGYYLIIKCEQVVQIQVLSRGYCISPVCTDPTGDPCNDFAQRPVPDFFPAQRAPF